MSRIQIILIRFQGYRRQISRQALTSPGVAIGKCDCSVQYETVLAQIIGLERSETVDDDDNAADAVHVTSEEELTRERDDDVTAETSTGGTVGSGDSESHTSRSPKTAEDMVSDNEDWDVLNDSEENTGEITSSDPDDLGRINSGKEEGTNLKALATTLDTNPMTKAATSAQTAQVTDFTPEIAAVSNKTIFQTVPIKRVQKEQPIIDMDSYAPVKRVELDGEKIDEVKGDILE